MSTSSPRTSSPSTVEAELELRVGEDHAALAGVLGGERVELDRDVAQPAGELARRRSSSAAWSKSIASSWPTSAFVEGVKIGVGRRSDSCRPGGSSMPETLPVAW